MHHPAKNLLLLLLPAAQVFGKSSYTLQTTYDASNFFSKFNFRDAAYYAKYGGDPTNGSVNYLSRSDATSSGIAKIKNRQVYLGVDSTKVAPLRKGSTTVHGRDSIRLESKDTFDSGIMIADIQHMPGVACGVWPSLWAYNFKENPVGEIDIIEGINKQTKNDVSLHTCGKCSFSNIGGTDERTDCNNGGDETHDCEDETNFSGCGNTLAAGSYGKVFNDNDGGVYVTWLTENAVRIYWWKRSQIPQDITAGRPDPSKWGKPAAKFSTGDNCDVKKYFKGLTIIINIALCGDNIDQATWNDQCKASTGVDTCDNYVANRPKAFTNVYWLFNSIKLYKWTTA